jgi:uncharacterized membrane protein YfcA
MTFSLLQLLSIILVAAGAGLFGAVLGVGGGIFVIPYLVLVLHVPMHNAVAASICMVVATSSAAASVNVGKGFVNLKLGMSLETFTVLGAMVGGVVAGRLKGPTLMAAFGLVLIPISYLMIKKLPSRPEVAEGGDVGRLGGVYFDPVEGRTVRYRIRLLPTAMGISLLAGGVSGLLGLGGGIFKVPAMNLLCGVPMKAATTTSNFMIGVTAAGSAFLYLGRGEVHPLLASAAVLGVLAGSLGGAWATPFLRGALLRRAFGLFVMATAIQMLWRATHG